MQYQREQTYQRLETLLPVLVRHGYDYDHLRYVNESAQRAFANASSVLFRVRSRY